MLGLLQTGEVAREYFTGANMLLLAAMGVAGAATPELIAGAVSSLAVFGGVVGTEDPVAVGAAAIVGLVLDETS